MWRFLGRIKGSWLGLALLLLSRLGSAQPAPRPAFEMERPGRRSVELTFSTQHNLIIVAARLNGHGPYNFILDTGVGASLLTDARLADSLHLPHTTEYRLTGVGGPDSGLRAYETPNVRVELPGIVAPRMTWLVLNSDVLDLSSYAGVAIHGILGPKIEDPC